jgi:hypothetical protein
MDRVSVVFLRLSLGCLLLGFALGSLMLSDPLLPGHWRVWFAPTHGHMLFVGWFLQFAIGVGYWLLPRKRRPEALLGYDECLTLVAIGLLNSGLLLRVVAEPAGRMGQGGRWADLTLVASSALQLAAIAIIVAQIWGRVMPKPKRPDRSDVARS